MTKEELIKALRTCADHNAVGDKCYGECPYNGNYNECVDQMILDAADALEELQQIADHHEQNAKDYWKEACEYKQRIDELENDKTNLEAEIINLEIALDKAHCELEAQMPKKRNEEILFGGIENV